MDGGKTATALFTEILFWKTDIAEFVKMCSEILNLVKTGWKRYYVSLHVTHNNVLWLPVTLIAKKGVLSTEMVRWGH
jgi:hypothetical protein